MKAIAFIFISFVLLMTIPVKLYAQADSTKGRVYEISAGIPVIPFYSYALKGYNNTYSGPTLVLSGKEKKEGALNSLNFAFKYRITDNSQLRIDFVYHVTKYGLHNDINERVVLVDVGVGYKIKRGNQKLKIYFDAGITAGEMYDSFFMRSGVTTFPKVFIDTRVAILGISEGLRFNYSFRNRVFLETELKGLTYFTKGSAAADGYYIKPNRLYQSTSGFSVIKLFGINLGYQF